MLVFKALEAYVQAAANHFLARFRLTSSFGKVSYIALLRTCGPNSIAIRPLLN